MSWAQHNEVDSLKKTLPNLKADSTKVKTLNRIFVKHLYAGEFDSAHAYVKAAQALAKACGFTRGLANSLNSYGMYYEFTGDYKEALSYYRLSLELYQKLGFKKGISNSYNNIGNISYQQSDYPRALESYLSALKIREAINDEIGMGSSYNNIGEVYLAMNNTKEALNYMFKSLALAKKNGDETQAGFCYNNIGTAYARQDPELATSYYQKSLAIRIQVNDQLGMSACYCNLGSAMQSRKKYPEALAYFEKGLAILDQTGEKSNISIMLNNIADVYIKMNDYAKATPYIHRALEVAVQNENLDDMKISYKALSDVEQHNGHVAAAFGYYKKYIACRDSIVNEENTKQLVRAEMNFEFGKKEEAAKLEQEKQKVLAAAESKKQKIVIGGVSGILLLVLGFALFAYRSYLQKQRANVEISMQKEIIEEKQKEIIDSITYAKRIQTAIMATEEEMQKHLPQSFLFYRPKDIIAGDFYFFEETPELYFIAAADCTGHGVPGALVSMVCSNALIRSVKEFGLKEPGEILDKTRDLVVETFKKSGQDIKDGMDISLCALYKNSGASVKLKWAGANNPLWLLQDGKISEIKADKQPVGQHENPKPFVTHEAELSKNGMLYLFTDGFADQFGGTDGKKFKYKSLQELLVNISGEPVQIQKQKLAEAFVSWKGKLDQVDDVCLIGIKV